MVNPSLAAHTPEIARTMPSLTRTWARRARRSLRRHLLGIDPPRRIGV